MTQRVTLADIVAARERIREARLDGGNSLHPYFVVGEIVGARRYGEALADIGRPADGAAAREAGRSAHEAAARTGVPA